jgi:hypothetical protein
LESEPPELNKNLKRQQASRKQKFRGITNVICQIHFYRSFLLNKNLKRQQASRKLTTKLPEAKKTKELN